RGSYDEHHAAPDAARRGARDRQPRARHARARTMSPSLEQAIADARERASEAKQLRPVVSFPPDAVLDVGHVAAALGVSPRTVERLDLPCIYLGAHIRRFLWSDVLAALRARGRAA